jgi:hypothetical protein
MSLWETLVERCVRRDEARQPERIAGSVLWWYETQMLGYMPLRYIRYAT